MSFIWIPTLNHQLFFQKKKKTVTYDESYKLIEGTVEREKENRLWEGGKKAAWGRKEVCD